MIHLFNFLFNNRHVIFASCIGFAIGNYLYDLSKIVLKKMWRFYWRWLINKKLK